ncbi:NAD(P)/FAD-dependent oxidoreductase, partial [Gammaproteobacteria bacterium]|nr:NAD(P)/FAD-dependent oxidoreductase [Gammaproteobacteria bacterium]
MRPHFSMVSATIFDTPSLSATLEPFAIASPPSAFISSTTALAASLAPLSKEFLKKNMETEKLFFKPESFYQDQNISFHANALVSSIDTDLKEITADSSTFSFDYLVFATGASPRLLSMPNADAKNLFYLRKISDVLDIHSQLESTKDIVLIGGGYIGLEVASAMTELGLNVTILEAEERILKRVT